MTPEVAALHRAMPFTRLVDYGMDQADARRLLAGSAAGAPWEDVAVAIAQEQGARSLAEQAAGHVVTAGEAARCAVAAWTVGQGARNVDDEVKRGLYRRQVAAVARVADLSEGRLERVEVPFGVGQLVGWLCLPASGTAEATVVCWGGLSGWGAAYLPVAEALTRRGLACLLAEGPGQGETRLLNGVHAGTDVVDGFARFLDVVAADSRLGAAVGVQGNSFGGLFAALLTSRDDRVGACVVNGAPSTPVVPPFRSAREQILALLGLDDVDAAEHVLHRLRFDPAERSIRVPLLVLHGGADPMVTREEQQVFLRAGDSATRTWHEWPEGEHTGYDHATERNALTADWFADVLRTGA